MEILTSFFVAVFGLVIGSFLNVVIFRLEKEEGFVRGRSYCFHCKHSLRWLDLIPVFSFLFLRGRCRYCGHGISWQYPVVEIATAALFLAVFLYLGFSNVLEFAAILYASASLVVIFVYDWKYYLIPDSVLFPAVAVMLFYRLGAWALHGDFLMNYLAAAIIAAGFFLAIFVFSRGRWIGFGDVKLAILLGLLLGFPGIIVGLWLAFLLGAVVGIGMMVFKSKGLKSEMPFAPFLILGAFAAFFWGQQLLAWYSHFIV